MNKPYVYRRAEDLGIPVVEGRNRVFVTVTDDDVILSKKANSKHCALARASLRLPGVNAAYFFRTKAFLEYEDKMVRFNLPDSVQREIVSFDRAQIFVSGVYQLTPPPSGETLKDKTKARRAKKAGRPAKFAIKPLNQGERAALAEAIRKVQRSEPPIEDSPEAREFNARIRAIEDKHMGGRIVSGVRNHGAPEPLVKAPARYAHRTQYVRDLREPKP